MFIYPMNKDSNEDFCSDKNKKNAGLNKHFFAHKKTQWIHII